MVKNLQTYIIYFTLTAVTVLFTTLIIYVKKDIAVDRLRLIEYLDNSVINEIKYTQGVIMNSFENFINTSKEYIESEEVVDFSTVKEEYSDVISSDFIKQYVTSTGYLDLGEHNSFRNILPLDQDFSFPSNYESLIKSVKPFQESMRVNNFVGTFIYPLSYTSYDDFKGISSIFSYESLIKESLIDNISKSISDDFNVELIKGRELNSGALKNFDLIFDLNSAFNLKRRDDYYTRVRGITNTYNKNVVFTDQYTYLTLTHSSGSINRYYGDKQLILMLSIGLLYIIIICSLLYIHLSGVNLRKNISREKEFTALISHELKTPLSVIALGSNNLKSGVVTDKEGVEYYGALIHTESNKLGKMIENILNISTNTVDESDVVLTSLDPSSIIQEVLTNLSVPISKVNPNITIKNLLGEQKIHCHGESIVSCLQNIIDNSIKYGAGRSNNKNIIITVQPEKKGRKNGVSIFVQDFGPGISSSEFSDVFKNYSRGKDVTDAQIPGSGLGLAISRRVMAKFNGKVILQKSPKEGTIFELWVPQERIS